MRAGNRPVSARLLPRNHRFIFIWCVCNTRRFLETFVDHHATPRLGTHMRRAGLEEPPHLPGVGVLRIGCAGHGRSANRDYHSTFHVRCMVHFYPRFPTFFLRFPWNAHLRERTFTAGIDRIVRESRRFPTIKSLGSGARDYCAEFIWSGVKYFTESVIRIWAPEIRGITA